MARSSQLRQPITPIVLSELRLLASARTAAQRQITELDEKLYLLVFAPPETQTPRRVGARP